MISLVYVSASSGLFSDEELVKLLEKSRENNTRLDVTGMLLYKDGNFMQVLEGPENTVYKLYDHIGKDPRHKGVIVLYKENVTQRQFPDWSMGFKNLRNPDLAETPGYNAFLNDPLTSPVFQSDPTRAQKLILLFRDQMR